MSEDWPFAIGTRLPRKKVHEAVGGQQQQGIVTPKSWPDVLVFTDPVKGKRFGYDRFEGLRPDGCYSYTGAGPEGDQEFIRGNAWLRDAENDGKTIRLFHSQGSMTTYIGAFTLGDPPFEVRQIPAEVGPERQGIIFNLAPLEADTNGLPPFGGVPIKPATQQETWAPPSATSYTVASGNVEQRQISRIEFELQADFGAWLRAKGHQIDRLRIPAGETIIEPDLFDATAGEIIEAKKSSARGYVCTAIGQVFDYVFNAGKSGLKVTAAILLPGTPESDLIGLCQFLNIRIWVREGASFRSL